MAHSRIAVWLARLHDFVLDEHEFML